MPTSLDRSRARAARARAARLLDFARALEDGEGSDAIRGEVAAVEDACRQLSRRDAAIVSLWRAIADVAEAQDPEAFADDGAAWVVDSVRANHAEVAELLDVGAVRDAIDDWPHVHRAPKVDAFDRPTLASTRSESFRAALESVGIVVSKEQLRAVLHRAGVSTRVRDADGHAGRSPDAGHRVQAAGHVEDALQPRLRPRRRRAR